MREIRLQEAGLGQAFTFPSLPLSSPSLWKEGNPCNNDKDPVVIYRFNSQDSNPQTGQNHKISTHGTPSTGVASKRGLVDEPIMLGSMRISFMCYSCQATWHIPVC